MTLVAGESVCPRGCCPGLCQRGWFAHLDGDIQAGEKSVAGFFVCLCVCWSVGWLVIEYFGPSDRLAV